VAEVRKEPALVATVTSTLAEVVVPVRAAGAVTVSCSGEITLAWGVAVVPKDTVVTPETKPDPSTVTSVLPEVAPDDGDNDAAVGLASTLETEDHSPRSPLLPAARQKVLVG
jgi:hypothetical protein